MIYESSHESKHRCFGYFHEYKHLYFGFLHESKDQEFGNIDEAIWCKIKCIVSHEVLHIAPHSNDKVSWYNVMVKLGTGETITESLAIIIGSDIITCAFYADDGHKKGE